MEKLVNQARGLIAKNSELNKNLKQTRKKLNTLEKNTSKQQSCSSCNNNNSNNTNNELDMSANSTFISTNDYNNSLMNSTRQSCFQSSESIASMNNDVWSKRKFNYQKNFNTKR